MRPVWPVHYMVCGLLLAASLVLPPLGGKMARSDIFSQLRQTRNLIQRQPQVVFATIHDGTSTFRSAGDVKRTTTYITSQVFIRTDAIDDKALAEDIAAIILRSLHDARKRERIQVILTHGYDIGISSFWKRHRHHFTPQQLTGVAGRDV